MLREGTKEMGFTWSDPMRFWIARIGLIVAALTAVPSLAQDTVPTSTQQINLTFAPVVKMVAPAVVNI